MSAAATAAVLCAALILAPVLPAVAAPAAGSAIGRWYETLPGWGCASARLPRAHQVDAVIGHEFDAVMSGSAGGQFSTAWLRPGLARIGAIYDPVHRIAAFREYGTDLGKYLLIGDVAPPRFRVREADLSSIAMGGKVRLGDSLSDVHSAFDVPTLGLTTAAGCAFPGAAAFRAVIFYGPPHKPKASGYRGCRAVGPDIRMGQTLGTVMFRNGRVAVLVFDFAGCAY